MTCRAPVVTGLALSACCAFWHLSAPLFGSGFLSRRRLCSELALFCFGACPAGVALIVFDEAHTWLSWPAWISAMARCVEHLTTTPCMALTATLRRASERCILRALSMDGATGIRQAFFRGNLMLRVEHRRPSFASSSAGIKRSNSAFEMAYRQRRSLLLALEAA